MTEQLGTLHPSTLHDLACRFRRALIFLQSGHPYNIVSISINIIGNGISSSDNDDDDVVIPWQLLIGIFVHGLSNTSYVDNSFEHIE